MIITWISRIVSLFDEKRLLKLLTGERLIDFRRAAIAAAAGAFGVRTATAISRIGLTGRAAIGANIGAGGLINAVAGDITRCGDTSIGEFATDLAFGGFGGACCTVSG